MHRTVILERRQTNNINHTINQFLLGKHDWTIVQGGKLQRDPSSHAYLRRHRLEFKGAKTARIYRRVYQIKGSYE